MEEFVARNHLHIINEDNTKTFQSSRGKSNIDLTITNNQMLADIKNWDISDEESASDHIIKYSIRLDYTSHDNNPTEPRYRIKEHQLTKFKEKLQYITKIFQMEEKERNTDEIDELSSQVNENTDIGQFTVKLEKVIHTTCNEICRQKTQQTRKKGKDSTLVDGNTKDNEEKD